MRNEGKEERKTTQEREKESKKEISHPEHMFPPRATREL